MTTHSKKPPMPLRQGRQYALLPWIFILLSVPGLAQGITLSLTNAPLEKAFREVEAKVPQRFVYTREMLTQSRPVTIQLQNATLPQVLSRLFESQPLDYTLDEAFIKVRFKPAPAQPAPASPDISGVVFSTGGEPLDGATIQVKGTNRATTTASDGSFLLKSISEKSVLLVSNVGYSPQEVALEGRTTLVIHLSPSITALDETVVVAYGTTTRRLATGSIGRVTAEEIGRQPVSNPLAALQGRVPGITITQSSGLNGAGYTVQVRGQNSLLQGSEPLFIIDGVPFAPGNSSLALVPNATNNAGISPLNLVNPSDIESIEILKDADATAIYGSRGANGVILITTKKGQAGAARVSANLYGGWSRITRSMDMLNTAQYTGMRREAFRNDGVTPTAVNAPDLLLWDTTRYTNLKDLLIGGTARTTNAQLSLSGGNTATRYRLDGGLHHQTTVFPTSLGDRKASAHLNLTHGAPDRRFAVSLTANYVANKNELHFGDPTGYLALPPHILLYDSSGKINWQEGGVTFGSTVGTNPLANFNTHYVGRFSNLLGNLQLSYRLPRGFLLRVNMGYNTVNTDEKQLNPSTSIDPSIGQQPFSYFATSTLRSWIVEPQASYDRKLGRGQLNILVGATAQENERSGIYANAANYSSDLFLGSIAGAANVTTGNTYNQYRYSAFFGRINYNWNNRYLLNASGRRDGSSRFAPGKRFSNFGAVGAGWIFSSYKAINRLLPFLSFGKLRTSYGLTGNDQIGDYKFIDTWSASPTSYQGVSALNPTALYNPTYEWELNKKYEATLELGFLKDRLFFSAAWFHNRSANQVVQYTLPTQTGFPSIGRNLDASIKNSGFEFQLSARQITRGRFTWSSGLNVARTRNKLLSFPGLATSSYATTYVIGQPLTVKKLYHYEGLDSAGVYRFTDTNKDGKLDFSDRTTLAHSQPAFFGGWQNTLTWKGWQLGLFLEFKKQQGLNYLNTLFGYMPGTLRNQPLVVLNRWQGPGDQTDIQRFTTTFGTAAYRAGSAYLGLSDAIYSDASFIRCKNLYLSYDLPATWRKTLHLESGRLYLQAQNLFTITGYVGADPENQNLYVLPPLKTLAAGIQFNLN